MILRDLVNATLGFEQLAKPTDVPSKSLHRMLSPKGNPSMDNLAAILSAVSKQDSARYARCEEQKGRVNREAVADQRPPRIGTNG